jgi:hypothetical protein
MDRCDCEDWKKWKIVEDSAWAFLYTHGIKYPSDGPKFKYCPFCGKELRK